MVPDTPSTIIVKPIHSGPNPQVTKEKLNVPTNQDTELPKNLKIKNRESAFRDRSLHFRISSKSVS